MKSVKEFLEESSTSEKGKKRLSSRGPKKDKYEGQQDRKNTSNKIAIRKSGFKTGSRADPQDSSDHYDSNSRHHSTNIASHKTQANYALSTVDRKYDKFSSSRRVKPTSSRVSGLRKIRRLLKTTRTPRQVHDISIHSNDGGISKNDNTRLISRGKSFNKERKGVPDALKNAGAETGDFGVGEPYGSMPHENPEKGKKVRAKLYSKDYGVDLDKRTGKMVGRVKTLREFLEEAAKRRLKFARVYHGTSKSNADKIKSGGFKDSEHGVYGSGVYSSTSRNVARRYSRDAGAASGKHDVDSGVVSSIIPSKKVKTIRQSSPESQEGRDKSKELRKSGQPAVRIKNAATGHETAKPEKGYEDEADYVVVDPNTANKGIEKSTKVFRPTKDQKVTSRYGSPGREDNGYYTDRIKPRIERPYVDRRTGTKKTQPKRR